MTDFNFGLKLPKNMSQVDGARRPDSLCRHCFQPLQVGQDVFCCSGCERVFQVLSELKLLDYYDLREKTGSFRSPIRLGDAYSIPDAAQFLRKADPKFQFLDLPEVRKGLEWSDSDPRMKFYLEGVHCTACLWLLEKLPEILPDEVLSARLDLSTSILNLRFQSHQTSVAKVASVISAFGYRPHPIAWSEKGEKENQKEDRSDLFRIATAGAMAGNIMLFSVSIYAGASGFVLRYFDVISWLLSLPVVFYSAVPLYRSAWSGLKSRSLSMDYLIAFAILSAFGVSTVSVLKGWDYNYSDSLTGLVFFLSASRYALRRTERNAWKKLTEVETVYPYPFSVRNISGEEREVWLKDLNVGDQVFLPGKGARVPFDGKLLGGFTVANLSILTGEIAPQALQVGDPVYSGSVIEGEGVWVEIQALGGETRLSQMLKDLQEMKVTEIPGVRFAERATRVFLWGVGAISIAVLFYLGVHGNWSTAFHRLFSVWIVSCPCALSIAIPLTYLKAFQNLNQAGVFLKDISSLDQLAHIQKIAFDKTGTLTRAELKLISFPEFQGEWTRGRAEILRSIVEKSRHPLSRSLVREFQGKGIDAAAGIEILDFQEIPGQGLQAVIQLKESQEVWKFFRSRLFIQDALQRDQLIVEFTFEDQLREDAALVVKELRMRGLGVALLSGDRQSEVFRVAGLLGLSPDEIHFELKPEEKKQWVLQNSETLFIGDGVNDAPALRAARFGLAVQGAIDVSLQAAGGVLTERRLIHIPYLIDLSRQTQRVLQGHWWFTFFYNLTAITLALMGMLHPLVAAILMPSSAFVVWLMTEWRMRSKWV